MKQFNKQDIVQAIGDQGAAWEEHSITEPGRPDAHLRDYFEPSALEDAVGEFVLPNIVGELQAHAKSQPGGQVDMGAIVWTVFGQGFATGFQLGRLATIGDAEHD